jgi:hypothetical protein
MTLLLPSPIETCILSGCHAIWSGHVSIDLFDHVVTHSKVWSTAVVAFGTSFTFSLGVCRQIFSQDAAHSSGRQQLGVQVVDVPAAAYKPRAAAATAGIREAVASFQNKADLCYFVHQKRDFRSRFSFGSCEILGAAAARSS